jgi:hypothetical protein
MTTPQPQASSEHKLSALHRELESQKIQLEFFVAQAQAQISPQGLFAQLANVRDAEKELRRLEGEIEKITGKKHEEEVNEAESDVGTNGSSSKAPSVPETKDTAGTGGTE